MATDYSRIADQVSRYGTAQNLMRYVNKETLLAEHNRQSNKKAAGVDKVTKEQYGQNLEQNLDSLIHRMKQFSYRPLPVRRTYIEKPGSDKMRPLGIPAYEDKLVQGVMANILVAVYESKFKDFSYGFRPRKDCHMAVKALNEVIMTKKTNFVVDADIKGFFDNVNHEWLIKFLEHDIKDKNFIRYIKRFLQGGIWEQGKTLESDKGTPQGGLISPILANVYLHYALDLWFEAKVAKAFKGEAHIIRYADDFVCCFQYGDKAQMFYGMLKDRMEKFGLQLAEGKCKIIRFGRYAKESGSKDTFDFLGFTHVNGQTKGGRYIVAHVTAAKKLRAKKQAAKKWLHENMHVEKCLLVKQINSKLVGHFRYYGITGNISKMREFWWYVKTQLYKTLQRRSQRRMNWETFSRFLKYNPLAPVKIYKSLLPT